MLKFFCSSIHTAILYDQPTVTHQYKEIRRLGNSIVAWENCIDIPKEE